MILTTNKSIRINGYCRSRYVIFRENYLGQAAFYTQKHTLLTHLFTIPKDVCVFRVEQNENKSKVCLASSPFLPPMNYDDFVYRPIRKHTYSTPFGGGCYYKEGWPEQTT